MYSFDRNDNGQICDGRIASRRLLVGLVVLSLFGSGQALAGGDAERGKEVSSTCTACHGPDGNSSNPEWPTLAGQHQKYLAKAIRAYQNGTREDVLMSGQVTNLSDEDIEDIAAYFASQKPNRHTADPALVAQGERIYRGGDTEKGISACIACHGPSGRGNMDAAYPALAGQHATYTANQLLAYRSNTRQSDTEYGQVMRNIAALLSEDEMKAVASYVQGLQ